MKKAVLLSLFVFVLHELIEIVIETEDTGNNEMEEDEQPRVICIQHSLIATVCGIMNT